MFCTEERGGNTEHGAEISNISLVATPCRVPFPYIRVYQGLSIICVQPEYHRVHVLTVLHSLENKGKTNPDISLVASGYAGRLGTPT